VRPRLVYVDSAPEDTNADPAAGFRSCVAASPVWKLFDRTGLPAATVLPPERSIADGCIGYHLRTGEHGLKQSDWNRFMDFADRHLRQ